MKKTATKTPVTKNSIRAIEPYIWSGLWVFDDKDVNLKREAFVAGADDLCDILSQGSERFTLLFSDKEFPNYQLHLKLKEVGRVGQTYTDNDGKEAWLCPALLLYFDKPPKHIFALATNHSEKKKVRIKHQWRAYPQFSRAH